MPKKVVAPAVPPTIPPNCFQVKVRLTRNGATVSIPKEALSFIDLQTGQAFCTMVGGVAQISGQQPNVVIPPLTLDPLVFMRQTSPKQ